MNIKQNIPFGICNFIERRTFSNIEYNTTISCPANGKVIIRNMNDQSIRELRQSDNCVLNPKPKGLTNIFKKIDDNSYEIYFINSAYISSEGRGEFKASNTHIETLEYETIFYYYKFEYSVNRAKFFVQSLIESEMDKYSEEYFTKKIDSYVKSYIREKLSKNLEKYGLSKVDSKFSKIKEEIEELLREEVIGRYGINLNILTLELKEDQFIRDMKEDTELRLYQIKKSKEE